MKVHNTTMYYTMIVLFFLRKCIEKIKAAYEKPMELYPEGQTRISTPCIYLNILSPPEALQSPPAH
jgi:hypothetical protein